MIYNLRVEKEPIRPVVYALGLYFFLGGMDSFEIGIGSILRIIALIPLAMALFDLRKLRIRFCATLVFQLFFWLLALVSLLYSVKIDYTISSAKTISLNLTVVFVFGMMYQYNQRELNFIQNALLAGGWLTLALMCLFPGEHDNGRLTLQVGEGTQDFNFITGYFLYTFSWHSHKMLLERKRLHVIPVIFVLVIVLLTGSRGGLLSLVVVFFVHICVNFAHSKHTIRNIILTVVFISVLLVSFDFILTLLPESVAERFSWDYIAENGTTGRSAIWAFLLRHFSEDSILRMLFGHGYGTVTIVNTHNSLVAHNLYLENLIALGIVGLLLQLIMQASVIRLLLKYRLYTLLGAYMGMLCMCLTLSLVAYKPIWNIMLVTVAIDFFEKSKGRSPASSIRITQEASQ